MSSPLEAENARLRAENAALRAELKELRAQFEELLQIAAKQSQENSELRTMLRRKVTGARPPPTREAAPADPEGIGSDLAAAVDGVHGKELKQ